MNTQNTPDDPYFKCSLCGSEVGRNKQREIELSKRNLDRAIDILSRQANNITPSVMAIREAINFLHQV